MYETPVKLKDPFPWINWHSKTNRTAKVIIKPGTYSGQKKTLYQISVSTRKYWEECPGKNIKNCNGEQYNWHQP